MDVSMLDSSKIIKEHLENVKSYIQFQMDAYGRNASMKHVNSLTVEANIGYGILWGLQSWNYMETGRSGGRVPNNFRQIIYQWSIDKGIQIEGIPYKRSGEHKYTPEERGRWRFAYFVARKIMLSGTALFRSGIREDIYSSVIERECNSILNEQNLIVSQIIDNINKNA